MNPVRWGAIGAAIGVPLIFWLFRKIFPPPSNYKGTSRPFDELKKEFQKWEIFTAFLFLVLAGMTCMIWWSLLLRLGAWNASRFKDATFALTADGLVWFLPALFLGIATGWYFTDRLLRIILRSRYQDNISYHNQKFKFDSEMITPPIIIFTASVSIIIVLMFVNWFVLFTEDTIVIKPLLSISKHIWNYSDVESIRTAPAITVPNGNIVRRREYVINFRDGQRWTTDLALTKLTPERKARIIKFVSLKAGVPITETDIFKKSELY